LTYWEVEPYIRHWVDVTVRSEPTPRFRGLLLWAGGTIAVFIKGAPPGESGDPGVPLPPQQSITITQISQIMALPDPPWLVEENKAEAVMRAQTLLNQDGERR
jgi:hypothetical protein